MNITYKSELRLLGTYITEHQALNTQV